jgi:ribosomal protein S18 acetylase RimI-like enzyme
MEIVRAQTTRDYDEARGLFEEYAASIGFDRCFEGFDAELASLPAMYGPPGGSLFLARDGQAAAGCVGVRPRAEGVCEMKRLYVRPAYRGTGLGRRLAEAVVAEGRRLGYARMVLDTLPTMRAAQALYRALGFVETTPYYHNPAEGTLYMALDLAAVPEATARGR